MLVDVARVDVAGAGRVPGPRDRADERRVLDEAVHLERLPRLEIDAHLDGEPRVALEQVVFHGGNHNRSPADTVPV